MIISIPTQSGMVSFALNASMLKLLALIASVLMLIAGYAVAQLATFILACTPVEFLHILICAVCLVLPALAWRFVRKQVHA